MSITFSAVCAALASGLVAALSMLPGDEDDRHPNWLAFVFGLALIAASMWWLEGRGGGAAALLSVGLAVIFLQLTFIGDTLGIRMSVVWLGVCVLSIAAAVFSYRAEKQREEAVRKAEAERVGREELIRRVKDLQTNWEPTDAGVAEGRAGALFAWVAVDPHIEIHAKYEDNFPDDAVRRIPIRVVLLNDSFDDLPLDPSEPLWRVEVFDEIGQRKRAFDSGEHEERLGAAERREFRIVWNGCDKNEALLPDGDYRVQLITTRVAGAQRAQASAAFRVHEAGGLKRPPEPHDFGTVGTTTTVTVDPTVIRP